MYCEFNSISYLELAKKLAEQLGTSTSSDPFSKEWMVVQNKETQQWVSFFVANELGIAANLEFILPSELVWKLYRVLNQDIPKILPSDRNPMKWQLFEILLKEPEELVSLGLQIPESDEGKSALADQIADVFDLYQIFRPEMVNNWSNGRTGTNHSSETWQQKLWTTLGKYWKQKPGFPADRAKIFLELNQALNSGKFPVSQLPDQISIFGLSQWPNPFARVLAGLSKHIYIYNYALKPFDVQENKRSNLYEEWGAPKRNSLGLLTRGENAKINDLENEFTDPEIDIHSTHNARREVEVLKYSLLKMFDSNPELKANDVLIMVPDLEEYGHLLKAVFDFNEGEPGIPISIPYSEINQEALVLSHLFEVLNSGFKVNRFFDLFELPSISESLGITHTESLKVRKWFNATNTHWGIKADESPYSLEGALNALFAGFTMQINRFETAYDLVPIPDSFNTDDVVLISKLSSFIQKTERIKQHTQEEKSISKWLIETRNWVFSLIEVPTKLPPFFDTLIDQMELVSNQSSIPFEVYRNWLLNELSTQNASSSGMANGVVVSTYIPYRNIPFKIKALLGFDEHSFPRKIHRPAFDLINQYPQSGDRITKEDDALLFLETILSTSEHLHISFVGQNKKSPKSVSMLVQQLHDADPGIPAITYHKLHKFDGDYAKDENNYSLNNQDLYSKIRQEKKLDLFLDIGVKAESFARIDGDEFIEFFKHPAKYYLQHQLQITNPFDEPELEDRESFQLDGLTRFSINSAVEKAFHSSKSEEELFDYFVKNGDFSNTTTSKNQFEHSFSATYNFLSEVGKYLDEDEQFLDLELELGNFSFRSRMGNLFNDRLILWRNGKARAKDFIEFWIKHLVTRVEGRQTESLFICKGKNDVTEIHSLFHITDPETKLLTLFSEYEQAMNSIHKHPFFPETSFAYADLELKGGDGMSKAIKVWEGSEFIGGEGQNFYTLLLWRSLNPFKGNEFKDTAMRIWEPFLEVLKSNKNG